MKYSNVCLLYGNLYKYYEVFIKCYINILINFLSVKYLFVCI